MTAIQRKFLDDPLEVDRTALLKKRHLEILSDAAHDVAERVSHGRMSFLEGVDFVWSAAEWAELVDLYGPDDVQAVLAEAFMGPRRA